MNRYSFFQNLSNYLPLNFPPVDDEIVQQIDDFS